MLLIFGIRRRGYRMGTVFAICGQCHTPAAQAIVRLKTFFTFFFIPLIPLGAKYRSTCTMCGTVVNLTKEQAETSVQQAQAQRAHAQAQAEQAQTDAHQVLTPARRARNEADGGLAATRGSSLLSGGLSIGTDLAAFRNTGRRVYTSGGGRGFSALGSASGGAPPASLCLARHCVLILGIRRSNGCRVTVWVHVPVGDVQSEPGDARASATAPESPSKSALGACS